MISRLPRRFVLKLLLLKSEKNYIEVIIIIIYTAFLEFKVAKSSITMLITLLIAAIFLSGCNPVSVVDDNFAPGVSLGGQSGGTPTIAITTPSNSSYINAANDSLFFAVAGTCSENNQSVIVQVDSTDIATTTCSSGSFTTLIDSTSLSSGAHTFTASLSDSNGTITTSAVVNVTRDILNPNIAISSPANNSFINSINDSATFTVSGGCSENSQIVTVLIDSVEAATATCSAAAFSAIIDSTLLSAGVHSLTAKITSLSGNLATSAAISITREVSLPSVAITAPVTATYINSGNDSATYSISGTCSENGRTVSIKVDGSTIASTGGLCDGTNFSSTVDSTAIASGVRSLTAYITDSAGNPRTSAAISVTRDASAPSIAITSPASSSYINIATNTTTFTVSGTCSESSQLVTVKINGANATSQVGGTCNGTSFTSTVSVVALSSSAHSFTAIISDTAGNSSTSSSVSVTKDTTAPTVPTSVVSGVMPNSLSLTPTMSWTAPTDANGIHHVEVQLIKLLNGDYSGVAIPWTTLSSGSALSGLNLLSNTEYYAEIRAVDNAGNFSSNDTTLNFLTPYRCSSICQITSGNGSSLNPVITPDGKRIVFESYSSDWFVLDTNSATDIFEYNFFEGMFIRSIDAGSQYSNGPSQNAEFSPDGSKIVFQSDATNLVPGDTNGLSDIFVKTIATEAIVRISTDSTGTQSVGGGSTFPHFSPDGTKVVFTSTATNLVASDTNGLSDTFVKTIVDGTIIRVSTTSAGAQALGGTSYKDARFYSDGTQVFFISSANNLVAADTNGRRDLFIKTLSSGAITRINTTSANAQSTGGHVFSFDISPDGASVVFESTATNLPGGSSGFGDIFLKNISSGAISRISCDQVGNDSDSTSETPKFSPDGTKVVFMSYATNLISGVGDFTNGQIFVKPLSTGAISLVSGLSNGTQGNGHSYGPIFDQSGTQVFFQSLSTNLGSGSNTGYEIFAKSIP